MSRVLIVSYYAPPMGGTQAFRVNQFTKHLPDHGWQPTVLTATESAYQDTWKTFRDRISFSLAGVETIRCPAPALEARAAGVQAALQSADSARASRDSRASGDKSPPRGREETLGKRVLPALASLASLLANPDRLVAWAPGAIIRGIPAASKADLIYACGPPYTNHIVAATLAAITRKPLVVMVDDPWVSMEHRDWRSPLQRRIQTRQERWVMSRARAVLTGTHGFRADMARRLGPELDSKTHVIYWGFDPEDYARTPPKTFRPAEAPFELLYTGSLRGEQYDVTVLLGVLHEWLTDTPDLPQRFQLRLIGAVDDRCRRMIAGLGLNSMISIEGFAPHRDLARRAATADALLLIINDSREMFRSYTSGKLFHYIGLERPILALVPPDGEAATIVTRKRLGVVARPSDPGAVRSALEQCMASHRMLRDRSVGFEEYSSSHLIARVARVFDEAVANDGIQ